MGIPGKTNEDVIKWCESPLVGREQELGILAGACATSRAGSARVLGVEGEAGIGKTALLRHFVRDAPVPVAWLSGDVAEVELPWGLLRQLTLSPAVSGSGELPELLDELGPEADPLLIGSTVLRLLTSIDPSILVVDDLHWADRPSLRALRFVARRLTSEPLLMVLSFRPPEPGGTWIDEGWGRLLEERGAVLRLKGLEAPELVRMAASLRHPNISLAGAARLHEHTGGNPLHVRMLLEQIPARVLASGSGPLPAPRDIALAVQGQLAACGQEMRTLVAAASVLGRSAPAEVVRQVAGLGEAEFDRALNQAIAFRLLEEVPGTSGRDVRFSHGLVLAAIYDDLSPDRRRALHARAAAVVPAEAALLHRVAASREPDEELAAAVERSAKSEQEHAPTPRAAGHLQRALQLTPPGPQRRPRLLTAMEALLVAGLATAAGELAGELTQLPADAWVDYVAGYHLLLNGQIDDASARLRRAWKEVAAGGVPVDAPTDLAARVASQLAIIGVVTLSYQDMVEYGEAAAAAESSEEWVRAFAWFARTVGLALAGRSDDALSESSSSSAPGGLDGLVARGMVRLWSDDLDGACRDLSEVVERASWGEPLRVGQALGFLAEAEYRRGQLDEAVLHADLAVADAEENGRVWDLAMLHALACYPQAARGDWAAATEHARAAKKWADLVGTAVGRAYAACAAAAVADARDDAEALLVAATDLEAAYDSREPGTHLFGPVRADALSRLGAVEAADEALNAFVSALARPDRRSVTMAVERVRAQLAAARGEWDGAEEHLGRAATLAAALGRPLETARMDLLVGRCRLRQGRRRAAEESLHVAAQRFATIGAWAYVAQAQAELDRSGLRPHLRAAETDVLARLTPTEAAVARLVAAGLSNREVADRLLIGVKTVEYHLSHVYTKLAIGSRGQLGALLSPAPA